ncbi:MAG: hypothetical protein HYS25_06050 [Ignavibacteriales bacterium]|nr:hypothetical protein [Ignavibacteriales bacterium]
MDDQKVISGLPDQVGFTRPSWAYPTKSGLPGNERHERQDAFWILDTGCWILKHETKNSKLKTWSL